MENLFEMDDLGNFPDGTFPDSTLDLTTVARSKMLSWSASFSVAFHVAPAVGETQSLTPLNGVGWKGSDKNDHV